MVAALGRRFAPVRESDLQQSVGKLYFEGRNTRRSRVVFDTLCTVVCTWYVPTRDEDEKHLDRSITHNSAQLPTAFVPTQLRHLQIFNGIHTTTARQSVLTSQAMRQLISSPYDGIVDLSRNSLIRYRYSWSRIDTGRSTTFIYLSPLIWKRNRRGSLSKASQGAIWSLFLSLNRQAEP